MLVSLSGIFGSRNRFPGSKIESKHSDRRASSWFTDYEGQLAYFPDQSMHIVYDISKMGFLRLEKRFLMSNSLSEHSDRRASSCLVIIRVNLHIFLNKTCI